MNNRNRDSFHLQLFSKSLTPLVLPGPVAYTFHPERPVYVLETHIWILLHSILLHLHQAECKSERDLKAWREKSLKSVYSADIFVPTFQTNFTQHKLNGIFPILNFKKDKASCIPT